MRTWILLLPVAGCVSPVQRTAPAYVAELAPLLQHNGLLAERVLGVAAGVHDQRLDVASAAIAWRDDIVPLADELRDHAALCEPPVEWSMRHAELVDVWGDRAQAYGDLADAMAEADLARWQVARRAADEASLREEAWFKVVNAEIAPMRLEVDQLP